MYSETKIKSESELVSHYKAAKPNSLAKEVDYLTSDYRRWIEHAPFMAVASQGEGDLDCSPRGDKAGDLVRVLDDKTITFPDWSGNNRLDTLRNIVNDPRISLLFLIPGINESLRVIGEAFVVTDEALKQSFAVKEDIPATVVVVDVQSVYFQCGKALKRSGLWQADTFVDAGKVPTAADMITSASS